MRNVVRRAEVSTTASQVALPAKRAQGRYSIPVSSRREFGTHRVPARRHPRELARARGEEPEDQPHGAGVYHPPGGDEGGSERVRVELNAEWTRPGPPPPTTRDCSPGTRRDVGRGRLLSGHHAAAGRLLIYDLTISSDLDIISSSSTKGSRRGGARLFRNAHNLSEPGTTSSTQWTHVIERCSG